jgi:hypothetical protein
MLPEKTKAIPFVRPFSAIGARMRSVIAQIACQVGAADAVDRTWLGPVTDLVRHAVQRPARFVR